MQISYVIITPNAIRRGKIGNILSRLLSSIDLNFIGISTIPITENFATEYIELIKNNKSNVSVKTLSLLIDYITSNFKNNNQVMFLFFTGNTAKQTINNVCGNINIDDHHIDKEITIHDTYSIISETIFEPSIIASPIFENDYNDVITKKEFKIILNLLKSQPNVSTNKTTTEEQSLVILKPDVWENNSYKAGVLIDIISKSGLKMVGCKLHTITPTEAQDFYQPVKDVIKNKMLPNTTEKLKNILSKEFNLISNDEVINKIATVVNNEYTESQFDTIMKFTQSQYINKNSDYCFSCMAMIYQGREAISKIRKIIGATDPSKADYKTIRKEFGTNIMKNVIHASDSVENAIREMKIIKMEQNSIKDIIGMFLE